MALSEESGLGSGAWEVFYTTVTAQCQLHKHTLAGDTASMYYAVATVLCWHTGHCTLVQYVQYQPTNYTITQRTAHILLHITQTLYKIAQHTLHCSLTPDCVISGFLRRQPQGEVLVISLGGFLLL